MYPELCTIVADKNDVGCRVGVIIFLLGSDMLEESQAIWRTTAQCRMQEYEVEIRLIRNTTERQKRRSITDAPSP